MHRSPRVLLAWIATVFVALATARVVGGDLTALHNRAHTLGADVPVVLAARDLPLGTTITRDDVRVVRRPASTVAADAVHDESAVAGRVVAVAFVHDDIVRTSHLAPPDRVGLGGVLGAGRRAVHVAPKDGYQPPVGSVVDVLATFDPATVSAEGAHDRAAVVAKGAQVLAADKSLPSESGDRTASGVTLLVTEAEARAVAYAASIGQVTLALAPPETACCTSTTS